MANLYSKVRHDIKTGDLIAWKTTKITSFFTFVLYLYQKILGADFTHVGIAFREGDRLFVLEATPPAVRLHPLSLSGDFYHIPVSYDQQSSQIDYLLLTLGREYSIFDLLRSMFKLGNDNSDYYCSELCADFYNAVGYINNEWAGVTPDSLVNEVVKTSGTSPIFVKNDRGNAHEL